MTATVLPTFLTALLLLALFGYISRSGNLWIQPGYVPFTQSPAQWLGRMILPWIAIAATQVGVTARLTRSAVLDVLGEDYIQTAHAKGLPDQRVIWLHVLRPSITPVLTSISTGFGILLGSAAIVDQVFGLGGIAQQLLAYVRRAPCNCDLAAGVVLESGDKGLRVPRRGASVTARWLCARGQAGTAGRRPGAGRELSGGGWSR